MDAMVSKSSSNKIPRNCANGHFNYKTTVAGLYGRYLETIKHVRLFIFNYSNGETGHCYFDYMRLNICSNSLKTENCYVCF